MDGLRVGELLLFEGFRFDRCAGGLFPLDQAGNATPVALGSRALDLLALLVRRKGELVSKDEIMAVVWPGKVVEEANLNVQISKLRHILDDNRAQGSCIQTVTGYGYRFTADVTPVDPAALPETFPPSEFADGGTTEAREEPCRSADQAPKQVTERSPPPPIRWLRRFRGVLASVIGALGLTALVIAVLNLHSPRSREGPSDRRL
jgi:DNA-binding winged helix-turn-helix (wHTH) protein